MNTPRQRNPAAASQWTDLLTGRVTASGAPGRKKIASWAAAGVTDVVTLQRSDEHAPWLPGACASAGLAWHHLPLSGRRLERAEDLESLARIPELLRVLEADPPRSVVVHCSAGLHRTGVCLYLLARHAGLEPDAAVAKVAQARALTAQELRRTSKRGDTLQAIAERTLAAQRAVPEG